MNTDTISTQSKVRAVMMAAAVADAIRQLGSVPSGVLYAQVMPHMDEATYSTIIEVLKKTNLVEETTSHLLRWIGDVKDKT